MSNTFYWIGGCTAATTLIALLVSMLVPLGPMFPALQLAGAFLGWVAAFIDQHSIQGR